MQRKEKMLYTKMSFKVMIKELLKNKNHFLYIYIHTYTQTHIKIQNKGLFHIVTSTQTIFDASREDDIFLTSSAVERQSTTEKGKKHFFYCSVQVDS